MLKYDSIKQINYVNYSCLIKMFRWILRTPLYFARKVKRPRQTTNMNDQIQEQQQGFPPKNLLHEYQQLKSNLQKSDQTAKQQSNKQEKSSNPMQFFLKMMAQSQEEENGQQLKKDKIDLNQKLINMGAPEQLISSVQQPQNVQTTRKSKLKRTLPSHRQTNEQKNLNFVQMQRSLRMSLQGTSQVLPAEIEKQAKNKLKMAQQDLMVQQIMKKTNQRQIKHLRYEQQSADQLGLTQKQKKLILRQEKIIEALQNKRDPSQIQYKPTRQEIIKMKYSPQLIKAANEYKNYQLGYFKQLILNQTDQASSQRPFLERRGLVGQEKADKNVKKSGKKEEKQIENSYKKLKSQEGLQLYQDEQFYKKKAEKQIKQKQKLDPEDRIIKQSLQKDLKEGNKISDVFLDDIVFPQDAKLQRRIALNQTSFARQNKKQINLIQRLDKLGVQFSENEVKELGKIALFQQKKMLEEQQNFQKYLHKKQKKKNMKKQLKGVHENILRDDIDFNKEEQSVLTVKQIKQLNDLQMLEDNYEKINQYYEKKNANFVQQTADQKSSKIHYKKTLKKMESVIAMYLANGLFNHGKNQLEEIQFCQIIPNRINTVLNVFWNMQPSFLRSKGIVPGVNNYEQLLEKQKKILEKKLSKQAGYISGKMTQLLRLRYGPEIRFHFDKRTKQTQQAVDELKQYIKQIAMVEVEDLTKKGSITSQEKEVQYFEKMIVVAKQKIQQFNSRKQLLSKNYKKKQNMLQIKQSKAKKAQQTKKEQVLLRKKRLNPMFEQQQQPEQIQVKSKPKRKTPSEKLWQTLDML